MAIPVSELNNLNTWQDRLTSILPPTIASAAVIAPTTFLSKISGTVAVSTIVPPTSGPHLICLIFTDPSPAALLTTGNIGSAVAPVQDSTIFLMYDPVREKYYPSAVSSAAQLVSSGSFLVSGGQVIWTSAYNFTVTAANYFINGQAYSSPQTNITLAAAHATLDRIDVVAVTTAGTVVVISGTAAAQPSEPDIDPGTQLKVGFIFVAANTTQPVVVNELIYADNAGGPTEWNWTTSGVGFNVNSTADPIPPSTKNIEGTNAASPAYAQGARPTGTIAGGNKQLVLYIKPKATWGNGRGLQLSFRNSDVLSGLTVSIQRTGTYGFVSSTLSYQAIGIPLSDFGLSSFDLVSQLRIAAFGGGIGFHIDNISVQEVGAIVQPGTSGITEEFADAKYLMLSTPEPKGITSDGGGSVLTTGVKGYAFIPFNFTIVGAAVIADQVGSMVWDVWIDAVANTIPTVADTITASAKPTLSAAQKSLDTTLNGWNRGPFTGSAAAPRIIGYNIDSATTVTRATLTLFLVKSNP